MVEELNPTQVETIEAGADTSLTLRQAQGEAEPAERFEAGADTPDLQLEFPRRSFLKLGLGVLSAVAALEIGAISLAFLQPRDLDEAFGGLVTAGPVASFPPGSVTEFPTGRFFLIRTPDGGFLAVHSRCPHLGCTVSWSESQSHFHCPCHASSFDFYGNLNNPPVPRALDIFPVQLQEATVLVDTSQLRQRQQFSPEQLVYA